jgi:uncharacterized RDD family membrane protein YckC
VIEISSLDQRTASTRELVPPEGVPLRYRVATVGERLAAFTLDICVIFLAGALGTVTAFWLSALWPAVAGLISAVLITFAFGLECFYFLITEARGRGRTPGKRIVGLQVVDRHGGELTIEALIARNLTRLVEVVLPLEVPIFADQLFPGLPTWARILSIVWLIVFAAFPLFNRDRLRVGDLIAGTIVLAIPRPALLLDLVAPTRSESRSRIAFTPRQLEVYGVFELQVLERVLRDRGLANYRATSRAVCEKIKTKIGWPRDTWDVPVDDFLDDFYAAQRAHLEQRLLFGMRKPTKHDPAPKSKRRPRAL